MGGVDTDASSSSLRRFCEAICERRYSMKKSPAAYVNNKRGITQLAIKMYMLMSLQMPSWSKDCPSHVKYALQYVKAAAEPM